jgi:Raf kinase inhibitor-like YbhB/YbcL family protein
MHTGLFGNRIIHLAAVVTALGTVLGTAACSPGSAPASGSAAGGTTSTAADTTHAAPAATATPTSSARPFAAPATPSNPAPIAVTSTTFTAGGTLPISSEFNGCGGGNTSPQLSWSGAPAETKSFVVMLFDPDAPTSTGFWHWTVFDIPATVTSLAAGAGANSSPVKGAKSGYTDFGFSHYGGPCPPNGDQPHHYIFHVYALDVPSMQGVTPQSTAANIMFSLRGHLLAEGSIEGLFAR